MMAFNSVRAVQDRVPLHNVIVSVFDKTGLEDLLVAMLQHCPGVRFYATGGSYDFINSLLSDRAGAHLVRMTDYTRQPEMAGGLVKTLDWRIYLGLLAETGNEAHAADLAAYQAVNFDMVIGNLYDFRTAAAAGSDPETVRQHIDIGGPSMLRAAAKNYLRVASVCKPALYPSVVRALADGHGCLDLAERQRLAGETFRNQAAYDQAVADWFAGQNPAALPQTYQLS
jgi:phosphoribosylaminoimidazolecarboxamide formyltransferase/IMP cyclohydrolase